ncbi:GntR family transcriptional regulator [Terrihabitans rhizophilus]|uniref:GntR family transcriptional regulator n=1 Tax=Terrihabitans rhizophilus TaxID=3092662 RepID=A0ABU4RPU8_9HYPH|nr:GntR family transcriptional regulator [Terrihabitans sp. PJ23]MDX6804781.1 GntR family transcriptional regulator [Terrihabitans sp. PJ23]
MDQAVATEGRREGAKPLYRQMKEDLVRRVMSGEWRPGELVPSEVALAQEYRVSVGTARKAIEEMVLERLVVRQRGRGTTIARNDERYEPFRFYRLHVGENTKAAYSTSYMSCTPARANAIEAKGLNVKRGTAIVRILRLRSHEGQPAVLEHIAILEERCPNVAAIINNIQPESIYGLIERAFHIIIRRVEERVQASAAEEEDAEILKLTVGSPILEVMRKAFDLGGAVIEFRRMRAVSDIHYFNEIG